MLERLEERAKNSQPVRSFRSLSHGHAYHAGQHIHFECPVSRAMRLLSARVLGDTQGGDEVCGEYSTFLPIPSLSISPLTSSSLYVFIPSSLNNLIKREKTYSWKHTGAISCRSKVIPMRPAHAVEEASAASGFQWKYQRPRLCRPPEYRETRKVDPSPWRGIGRLA